MRCTGRRRVRRLGGTAPHRRSTRGTAEPSTVYDFASQFAPDAVAVDVSCIAATAATSFARQGTKVHGCDLRSRPWRSPSGVSAKVHLHSAEHRPPRRSARLRRRRRLQRSARARCRIHLEDAAVSCDGSSVPRASSSPNANVEILPTTASTSTDQGPVHASLQRLLHLREPPPAPAARLPQSHERERSGRAGVRWRRHPRRSVYAPPARR